KIYERVFRRRTFISKHVNQEEVIRDYDLWDDLGKSNEILIKLADTLASIPFKAAVPSYPEGERSRFANKIKALNRLKAKLLIVLSDQGVSSVKGIKKGAKMDRWSEETRKYVFRPTRMVHDLKSGVQLPDVNAVLNGNLDPLVAAHISSRQTSTVN
ncbi:hypothetical protein Pfo_028291, partial [Paulownia fortunei]